MGMLEHEDKGTHRLRVWDLPVRVFHWVLVFAIGFLWYSGENADDLERHMQIGTAVLALLLFRVVWGFVGSTTARFKSFVRPFAALGHLKELKASKLQAEAGHNPLGGLMVLVLLTSLLVQVASGLYTSDEVFSEGPLYANASENLAELMASVHHLNFNLLLGLVVLHVCAIVFYLVVKKTNLVRPMFTGVMAWPASVAKPTLIFRSAFFAIAVFAVLFLAVQYLLA